jgi:DNA-binding CsgD family transcriptional regulator
MMSFAVDPILSGPPQTGDAAPVDLDLVPPLKWIGVCLNCVQSELTRQSMLGSHTISRWSVDALDTVVPNAGPTNILTRELQNTAGGILIDDYTLQLRFQHVAEGHWFLTLYRSRRELPFTYEDIPVALRFAEPFECLISLWSKREEASRRAALFEAFLHLLDCGVILINSSGSIVFANRRADIMLHENMGLVRGHGHISATSFRDAILLQAAINYAFQHATACDFQGNGNLAPLISISRSKKTALTVAVLPIPPNGREPALVALYAVDPISDLSNVIDITCRMYGLSRTETRLATLLVSGMTIADAAREIRIREQTARAYLRHIFSKLDINRQADLVRIILTGVVRLHARLVSIST